MLEWIIFGLAMLAVAAAFSYWKLRSIDSEIRYGVERARRRDFHETGRWSKLPWESKD